MVVSAVEWTCFVSDAPTWPKKVIEVKAIRLFAE